MSDANPEPSAPELEKLRAKSDDVHLIFEFIETLPDPLCLCRRHEDNDHEGETFYEELDAWAKPLKRAVYAYLGVDYDQCDREIDVLLAYAQAKANARRT